MFGSAAAAYVDDGEGGDDDEDRTAVTLWFRYQYSHFYR